MKNLFCVIAIFIASWLHSQIGHVSTLEKISDTQGNFQPPLINNALFGYAVADIGDLNNDGIGDLAVGAHDVCGEGRVHVIFMNTNGTVSS